MKASDFYFDLPEELIAQTPIENRDQSRLLKLDRKTGQTQHLIFNQVFDYLNPGDCLVLNDTRVIPARLLGIKEGGTANIEFVLLKKVDEDVWEILVRPGKRAKVGARFSFGNGEIKAEIIEQLETGNRLAKFYYEGVFEQVLDKVGIMPLPPYITKTLEDRERYQTVYSREKGSAAAPTAGLHFTKELLKRIEDKGVKIVYVTLHVGLGTFRPVKVEDIHQHVMHSEYFKISEEACNTINKTKAQGSRVVAVGTTSCRVLESCSDENGIVNPNETNTDIFIYPGYAFKVIDGLITNFHLPESTLIMLVSALAGRENIMNAYKIAVDNKYRFFSFGDAMLIL